MCSYESSGYHRKNLMTYDYNVKETSQGVFYGIDVYATNDNVATLVWIPQNM